MTSNTAPPDWTIAYYREQYADSVRPMLTEERSRAEVDFLLRATGLQPGALVADTPYSLDAPRLVAIGQRGEHA